MAATPQTTPSLNAPAAKNDTHALLSGTKKTKPEANYRPGNNDAKVCHTCASYENPSQDSSSCLKVVGVVQGTAVCDLWSEKPAMRPDTTGDGSHKIQIKIHTGSSGSSINRQVTETPNY